MVLVLRTFRFRALLELFPGRFDSVQLPLKGLKLLRQLLTMRLQLSALHLQGVLRGAALRRLFIQQRPMVGVNVCTMGFPHGFFNIPRRSFGIAFGLVPDPGNLGLPEPG